jgi:membrane protein CcdC involved in cytochrome C biogenesis
LNGGLGRGFYVASVALVALVGLAMTGLLVRSLATGQFAGALFVVGFAVLFAWQVGGFIRRNRPLAYDFDHLPQPLLP